MEPYVLILTVGLPRSGKSMWAQKRGCPVVNPDSIRIALHGQPYIQEAEAFVWAIAYVMVEALFVAGHPTVVVDATNNTTKRRDEWEKRFSKRAIVEYETFDASKEVCIERAKASGREDLIPVIERMAEEKEQDNGTD